MDLKWAKSIGGLKGLVERSNSNLAVVADWVEKNDWIDFLAEDVETRSNTSICLKIVAPWYLALSPEDQASKAKALSCPLGKRRCCL